jgi:hypothetical protein
MVGQRTGSCYLLTDFLFKADLVAAEQEPDLLRVDSVVAVHLANMSMS